MTIINIYRYRSFYYDEEIGLYYLQSRYYNPEIGRFVNGDEIVYLFLSDNQMLLNLFAYCNNSPAVSYDPDGHATLVIAGATISLSAVLSLLAIVIVIALIFDKGFRKWLADAATRVWRYTVDTAGYLTTAITEVIAVAKRARRYSGNEDHHIVAQTDHRAASSRELFKKYDLKTWQKYNVVTIKKTLHKHLHTSAYHYGVYLVLKGLEIRGKNKKERKNYVLAGVILIGVLLKAASNTMK